MKLNKRLIIMILVPVLIVATVMAILGMTGVLKGHSMLRIGYVGSQTPGNFTGRYLKLDGTLTYKMRSDNKELYVDIVTEKGKIGLLITDPDGKQLYRGNELDTCSFSVMTEGRANITIEADNHEGSFSFSYKKPKD